MKRTIKQSFAVCTAAIGLFITSCNQFESHSTLHEHSIHCESDSIYVCSMHPEIKGKKGDKCSKCGMELTLLEGESSQNIEVKFTTSPRKLKVGEKVHLSTSVLNNGKNAKLDIVHEKKIHMLIVDEELTWFDHVHPEEQADGSHNVEINVPHAGKYYSFADFKVQGAAGSVNKQVFEVEGNNQQIADTTQNKWISNVDGYTVTLINGSDFQTNRPQHIGIRIEKDGNSITSEDIEPYLGAIAHVVIIGKNDKVMLHVHPEANKHVPIHGETRFEKPGIYRMWVQFQLDGKVHTADFTVGVIEGLDTAENSHHDDHGKKHHH